MKAYINWGRWVVDCACYSAELLEDYPDEVVCHACGTAISMEYPENTSEIEAVLSVRPPVRIGSQWAKMHENWEPGETIEDLLRENTENGMD